MGGSLTVQNSLSYTTEEEVLTAPVNVVVSVVAPYYWGEVPAETSWTTRCAKVWYTVSIEPKPSLEGGHLPENVARQMANHNVPGAQEWVRIMEETGRHEVQGCQTTAVYANGKTLNVYLAQELMCLRLAVANVDWH